MLLLLTLVNTVTFADNSFSISSTTIHSYTKDNTFYLNKNSSTTGNTVIFTYNSQVNVDNKQFKLVLSNKYDNTYIEDMYVTEYYYLKPSYKLSYRIGTLDNAKGLYYKNSSSNPSIYPPQGVYNHNTQNSMLEYSTGVQLGFTYISPNFNTFSLLPFIGKQRNLSSTWANYSAFGFNSPYSAIEADGKNIRGITGKIVTNNNVQIFANYFESSLTITPKKRLTQLEMYSIYNTTPDFSTFLIEGDYKYSVSRYGICLERPKFAIGSEYYLLNIKGDKAKLNSKSEGNYVYVRYYMNKYALVPYVIFTEAHKYGKKYSSDRTIGIKYLGLPDIYLAFELHNVHSDSWLEIKVPTEKAVLTAKNNPNFNVIAFNITYMF